MKIKPNSFINDTFEGSSLDLSLSQTNIYGIQFLRESTRAPQIKCLNESFIYTLFIYNFLSNKQLIPLTQYLKFLSFFIDSRNDK